MWLNHPKKKTDKFSWDFFFGDWHFPNKTYAQKKIQFLWIVDRSDPIFIDLLLLLLFIKWCESMLIKIYSLAI